MPHSISADSNASYTLRFLPLSFFFHRHPLYFIVLHKELYSWSHCMYAAQFQLRFDRFLGPQASKREEPLTRFYLLHRTAPSLFEFSS